MEHSGHGAETPEESLQCDRVVLAGLRALHICERHRMEGLATGKSDRLHVGTIERPERADKLDAFKLNCMVQFKQPVYLGLKLSCAAIPRPADAQGCQACAILPGNTVCMVLGVAQGLKPATGKTITFE